MRDLEYRRGAKLFERNNGGARPTVAGLPSSRRSASRLLRQQGRTAKTAFYCVAVNLFAAERARLHQSGIRLLKQNSITNQFGYNLALQFSVLGRAHVSYKPVTLFQVRLA
jgi:hypothetical protein